MSTANRDGAETRARLIDVATRHFAELGFNGTGLRAIQREAGVNPAMIHYHFGSKDALYRAVVASRIAELQAERLRRLDALPSSGSIDERIEAVLSAYVAPHLEFLGESGALDYGRIVARAAFEQWGPGVDEAVSPVRDEFVARLHAILPDAPIEKIARAFSFTIILMVSVPFDRVFQSSTGIAPETQGAAVWEDAVITFGLAGFLALCGVAS